LHYYFIICGGQAWNRRGNEGSFGREAITCTLGQPNLLECADSLRFLFCLYAAKISLSFCHLFCHLKLYAKY